MAGACRVRSRQQPCLANSPLSARVRARLSPATHPWWRAGDVWGVRLRRMKRREGGRRGVRARDKESSARRKMWSEASTCSSRFPSSPRPIKRTQKNAPARFLHTRARHTWNAEGVPHHHHHTSPPRARRESTHAETRRVGRGHAHTHTQGGLRIGIFFFCLGNARRTRNEGVWRERRRARARPSNLLHHLITKSRTRRQRRKNTLTGGETRATAPRTHKC